MGNKEKKFFIKPKERREAWDKFCLAEGKLENLKAFVQNEIPFDGTDGNKFGEGVFDIIQDIRDIFGIIIKGLDSKEVEVTINDSDFAKGE